MTNTRANTTTPPLLKSGYKTAWVYDLSNHKFDFEKSKNPKKDLKDMAEMMPRTKMLITVSELKRTETIVSLGGEAFVLE